MTNLFDLPFEDEPREDDDAPLEARAPAAPPAPATQDRTLPPPSPARSTPASAPAAASRATAPPSSSLPPVPQAPSVLPGAPTPAARATQAVTSLHGTAPGPPPASAIPASAPAAPVRRVLSVSELNANIRELLEDAFIDVWVEGELSNVKAWNTGHLYFTLKDGAAQIKAVMFRSAVRYLRFKPQDGQHVVARGRISAYEPKGEYQIVCETLEPRGLGQLQMAFEQLKKKLEAAGLFDAARKRPLPLLPRKIGVVTSLDGAAVRDIIKVLSGRYANVHVIIRPARVQGDGAAAEVAQAVRQLGRLAGVDVIIVARGGGSLEDLWAFNEEMVARAIAASPVPVISGVGHQIDFTIADFVADVRAATPSNAAELVLARKDQLRTRIDHLAHRLDAVATQRIQQQRARVHLLTNRRGLVTVRTRVGLRGRHLAELTSALRQAMARRLRQERRDLHDVRVRLEAVDQRRRLANLRARLVAADGQLSARAQDAHHRADRRLRTLAGRLENLSPLAVLSRGYAVCWAADRTTIVRDARSVAPGETVHVGLEHGSIECEVKRSEDSRGHISG
jgi:exodeoxyribonuclease VII large subunit